MLGLILKSKGFKIGGGLLGGGGLLALIFSIYTSVVGQIDKAEANSKSYTREHVVLKLEPYKVEIVNLKSKVNDTNEKVNKIYEYLLKNN